MHNHYLKKACYAKPLKLGVRGKLGRTIRETREEGGAPKGPGVELVLAGKASKGEAKKRKI